MLRFSEGCCSLYDETRRHLESFIESTVPTEGGCGKCVLRCSLYDET